MEILAFIAGHPQAFLLPSPVLWKSLVVVDWRQAPNKNKLESPYTITTHLLLFQFCYNIQMSHAIPHRSRRDRYIV